MLFPRAVLERLRVGERDLMLRHEFLHLSAGDVPLLYFQQLIGALYWWNPMVAKISEFLSEAREGLCDEALVDRGAERQTYARFFVRLGKLSSLRISSAVSGSPRHPGLKARLECIIHGDDPSRRMAWWGAFGSVYVYAINASATVFVGETMPKPVLLSDVRELGFLVSEMPPIEVTAVYDDGRRIQFDWGFNLVEGETTKIVVLFDELFRLSYLGYRDGNVRLRWEGSEGALVREIAWPASKIFSKGPPAHPDIELCDRPPATPEGTNKPFDQVAGDPKINGAHSPSGGFSVVGVNFVDPESFKKIFKVYSDANSAGQVESAAQVSLGADESVVQEKLAEWGFTTESEPPALLDRFYGEPNLCSVRIRLNDSFHEKAKAERIKWYHDGTDFSRRYCLERGLDELRQEVPGSLERDQRISDAQTTLTVLCGRLCRMAIFGRPPHAGSGKMPKLS